MGVVDVVLLPQPVGGEAVGEHPERPGGRRPQGGRDALGCGRRHLDLAGDHPAAAGGDSRGHVDAAAHVLAHVDHLQAAGGDDDALEVRG